MTRRRAPWRIVWLSYPCPTCNAAPGEPCLTTGGNEYRDCHADRTRHGQRCPRCGTVVSWDDAPGTLCARCSLLRTLETERATKHRRRT
jgi:endogenous inhibitor of DNA gyrase (YacG/DUF329 family)